MTDADKPAFAAAFGRLCIALREKEPDAASMRVYFEALRLWEIELVTAAALKLGTAVNDQGQAWFPKAGEWRAAVARLEADRIQQQKAILSKLPEPLCADCGDTGWAREEDRVRPCRCRRLRRMELLGRRPMPTLPEATEEQSATIPIEAAVQALADLKGMP